MPTLEEIKKRKLEEMMSMQQERLQNQSNEQAQMQQQVAQIEEVVKRVLTKEALARYGNLKTAHQEKAVQLLLVLLQAMQKGQIKGKVDDAMLKKLLEQMEPKRKEFKISRV
ncbi:MAG TPA: DNA-binding protein [Candidatus Nanoarchaeia archaeon]|nr:DNA-binding protein [Candidatus Nanoarchaeia archaeon]